MNQITITGARFMNNIMFGGLFSPPASYYIALMHNEPVAFIGGDELSEPPILNEDEEPTGYQRLEVPNNINNWIVDDEGTVTNNLELQFEEAIEDWGTIRYWAICNSETDGDALYIGSFFTPVDIDAGDTVLFPAGSIAISSIVDLSDDSWL